MSGHLEITIDEIPELRESVDRFAAALERFTALRGLTQEWYTEEEACRLKGVPYNSLRKPETRRYLPNYGRRTEVLHTGRCRYMYHRDQVAYWLPLTAAEIDEQWEQELRLRGVSAAV